MNDPRVSEAYRDAATERTPEHLDAAVLKMAADAARPRYSIMRTWTRPVAWAAVVMLSFGLLLELTQAPVQSTKDQEVAAPASVAEPELEEQVLRQDSVQEQELADDQPAAAAVAKRERDSEGANELKAMDADMIDRAEEMARMQQGAVDVPAETAPAPASAAAEADLAYETAPDAAFALSEKTSLQSSARMVADEGACDAETRAEPETWLACIEALEQAGAEDIARDQRELLAEAFPDFEQK